jgi:hypothetical protein
MGRSYMRINGAIALFVCVSSLFSVPDVQADDLGLYCYPNPARIRGRFLTIAFEVNVSSDVTLEIYTIDGHKVKTIMNDIRVAPTDEKLVVWAYRNNGGEKVDPGVYVAVLRISDSANGERTDRFVFVLE